MVWETIRVGDTFWVLYVIFMDRELWFVFLKIQGIFENIAFLDSRRFSVILQLSEKIK